MAYSKATNEADRAAQEVFDMELLKIRTFGLDLSPENVAHWFQFNPQPSPTMFALDFHLDPSEIGATAKANDLVRDSLNRMVGMAEEQLYFRVFGPKAVIQRVETLMSGTSTVSDSEVDGEDNEQGLFVSA